jgi:hypothetical protein
MKPLALPLVVLLAVAATTAALIALDHAARGTAAVVQTPQQVTLKVVSDDDQLVGTNLVVRPGPVVLVIVNYARHAHTFSVPALGIERLILPGSATAPTRTVVRFRAPRGVFTWYCRLPCENAMTGHIYVSDKQPRLHGPLWSES